MKWQNLFSVKNKNNILKCLRDNLHEMSKLIFIALYGDNFHKMSNLIF